MCMVAIVIIYTFLKDRPLSAPKSGLLLTLANVLGKIASAALIVPTSEALGQLKWNWFHNSKAMWDFEIFDKASRGPWGAMMLLFRTRGRSLAALGAILILLLLAIDTFFQQVVDMPTRWTLESKASMLPIAIQYRPQRPVIYNEGLSASSKDLDIVAVVEKFAFENGTQPVSYGNGARPDIPLSCPTSNCTWPVYETFGVCSLCEDVSAHLTYACLNSTIDWTANTDGGGPITGISSTLNITLKGSTCGYFLNATSLNPTLMSGYLVNADGSPGETLLMRILPLVSYYEKKPLYENGSINFKKIRDKISDVLIVSAVDGSASNVHQGMSPIVQECVLSWCVKSIHSSYDSGQYKEEILDTYFNTTEGPYPWISKPYTTKKSNGLNGTDVYYTRNISIEIETSSQRHLFSSFGTTNDTTMAITQSFRDIFPAFTTEGNGSTSKAIRFQVWYPGAPFTRMLNFNPWIAPNNVTRHMERLAIAMTNIIRSDQSRKMLSGEAFSRETFISIRWEWLSFPFILLLCSLVFLVLTMIKTSDDGAMGIWKTSAMPALIYSLPKDIQKGITPSSTGSTAKKGAQKIRIKLLPDHGWRVSGQMYTSPTLTRRNEHRGPAGWI
ncbi:hypothetical protein GQ44DRAFT_699754 [Phaeosphaeriaceae sp. PMI808]|nr:hypothetical protein GQ44DRAFT_699754 [Phaeosphaeriaceae sp. PMI808]